jgi:glutathione S-transferase
MGWTIGCTMGGKIGCTTRGTCIGGTGGTAGCSSAVRCGWWDSDIVHHLSRRASIHTTESTYGIYHNGRRCEYLDETIAPGLHPEDPVERAINRAWTDYVPTFASTVTATAYADTEAEYNKAAEQISVPFERLERALEKQGSGPLFNGAKYSLVDAAYAPFLQRYVFLDRVKKLGHIEKFPRLKAWCEALLNRPSTHSFAPAEFEAMYRENLKRRNKWIAQFIKPVRAAAE